MRNPSARSVIVISVVLALSATPAVATAPRGITEVSNGSMTTDDVLARINSEAPSFGGLYLEPERGEIIILSTEPAMINAVAVRDRLSFDLRDGYLRELTPVVAPATYTFAQLKAWHDRLSPAVLQVPGTILTDIDDANNSLLVGVEDVAQVAPAVRTAIDHAAVPHEVVQVRQVSPVAPETSLQDLHRPLVGGLQVASPGFICTLGAASNRAGTLGFITNSHCTNVQGGVEATPFYQPTPLAAHRVGTETVDPALFTGGVCPTGKRCRYSDAAFVAREPLVGVQRGRIADPFVVFDDPTAWDGVSTYSILSEANPQVNDSVIKVGRTTGETTGRVTNQCVNVNVANTDIQMLCEAIASHRSSAGDSGAPVFRIISGKDVTLIGIHWGSGGVFSDIGFSGVQRELGSVGTCVPERGC